MFEHLQPEVLKRNKDQKLMSFLKKGPKCHTNVRKPQCDHMAICFSQFLEFFEIMAHISYLHLKMSPKILRKNKRSKIDATLKKGPKCRKYVSKPQWDHMTTFLSIFKNPLKVWSLVATYI